MPLTFSRETTFSSGTVAVVEPSKEDEPRDPSATPTPRPPGLANVFWGAGIKYQKLTPDQRRKISRLFAIFTVVTALAVGAVAAILNGILAGAISAVVTPVLMGLLMRTTLRDYD